MIYLSKRFIGRIDKPMKVISRIMQNRYSGDIGDFSKLGLLRKLDSHGLSIGLNWYLRPDEDHNQDGKHTAYLDQERFFDCDEPLRLALQKIVCSEQRSVEALKSDEILRAVHFDEILDFNGKTKDERRAFRVDWHAKALQKLSGVDIVCADPDNGLIVPSAADTARENKYILPKEIEDYYCSGASVIYYQHKARKPDKHYVEQHEKLLQSLAFQDATGLILKFKTTSQRYYCFIMQKRHRRAILEAVEQMIQGKWGEHFCYKLMSD